MAAVDQDEHAHAVYTARYDHPAHRWNLAGVKPERLASLGAALWWMSPPCQPFTVRGRGRDVHDRRCRSFLHLLQVLDAAPPPVLALENVPGFAGSTAHGRLRAVLHRHGYHVWEQNVCPSELGVPNRRRRFYLLARRDAPLPPIALTPVPPRPLSAFLDPIDRVDPELYVEAELQRRYDGALAIVHADDPEAVTHCFTSAYGRSPVYSGSYLQDAQGLRRFSPEEIVRLLGFHDLRFPPAMPRAKRWKLAGNSLSVTVVRQLLAPLAAALR